MAERRAADTLLLMRLPSLVVILSLAALFTMSGTASAAWLKPGKCVVPADQREYYEDLDPANNRFSTKRVPCVLAGQTIQSLIADGRWSRRSFTYKAMGARWYMRLSCRSRVNSASSAPQPGRVITCRVRKGQDAETTSRTRNLTGGRIKWTTAYTG